MREAGGVPGIKTAARLSSKFIHQKLSVTPRPRSDQSNIWPSLNCHQVGNNDSIILYNLTSLPSSREIQQRNFHCMTLKWNSPNLWKISRLIVI